jgi:predicted  nucleic acid-binding Zn-ribbon protein
MGQIDDESILSETTSGNRHSVTTPELSETAAEQSGGEGLKLVPVGESIRYRKRAQSAEKKAEALVEQLSQAESRVCEMAEQLQSLQIEQKLMRKLAAVGAVDLETAMLIAKARVEGKENVDMDGVVEQLRKEKQYLFAGQMGVGMTAKRTAGAKDRMQNSPTVLEKVAKEAAATGSRTDLQRYLKLRRSFV